MHQNPEDHAVSRTYNLFHCHYLTFFNPVLVCLLMYLQYTVLINLLWHFKQVKVAAFNATTWTEKPGVPCSEVICGCR